MKNVLHKILHHCWSLKEVKRQTAAARAELKKVNEETAYKKKELKETEDMLRENQKKFMDIYYYIHQTENSMAGIYEKQRKESKKLDDIINRYKVMYSDAKIIAEKLERFRRRAVGVEYIGAYLDIPYADVKKWMDETFIDIPEYGKKLSITELCRNALRREDKKKKEELMDHKDGWVKNGVWEKLYQEVLETMKQIKMKTPEII